MGVRLMDLIRSFIFMTLFVSPLYATTLGGGAVSDLSRQAQWIGRIQIDSIDSISSSSEFPFSRVQGKILEVFKGSGESNQTVSFQMPGGRKGQNSFAVMGFPIFKSGGEYVVFLDSEPRMGSTALTLNVIKAGLVGWTAFRVMHADQQVSARMVIRAGEPSLLQNNGRGRMLIHDRSIKTYDDFVSEIYRSLD